MAFLRRQPQDTNLLRTLPTFKISMGQRWIWGIAYHFQVARRDRATVYAFDPVTFSVKQTVQGKTLGGLAVKTGTKPGDTNSGIIVFQIPETDSAKDVLIYNDGTSRIALNL